MEDLNKDKEIAIEGDKTEHQDITIANIDVPPKESNEESSPIEEALAIEDLKDKIEEDVKQEEQQNRSIDSLWNSIENLRMEVMELKESKTITEEIPLVIPENLQLTEQLEGEEEDLQEVETNLKTKFSIF